MKRSLKIYTMDLLAHNTNIFIFLVAWVHNLPTFTISRQPPIEPPPEPERKRPPIKPPDRTPKPKPIKDPPVSPPPDHEDPDTPPTPIGDPPDTSDRPIRMHNP